MGSHSDQQSPRLEAFEDCGSALADLFKASIRSNGAQGFFEYLESARRFSHLSIFNAMMVQVQRPGAVMVGSRSQWADLGRQPAPDAIPIIVLQPFGPIMFLYDHVDTIGEPLPFDSPNPFTARGTASERDVQRIIKAANEDQIAVERTDSYGDGLAGTAAVVAPSNRATTTEPRWRVRVNSRQAIPVQLCTLGHELGHVYCGHLGEGPKAAWPNRGRLTYELREVEAESVAWLICMRRGVEPNSTEYLHDLIKRVDLEQVGMWAIYSAANRAERYATSRG